MAIIFPGNLSLRIVTRVILHFLPYNEFMNTKILVVDDDIAINELIKVNLELCGYKVVQAFDGIKGFALCKQEKPSLVILDVMMPEVDGFTVAQRIRKTRKHKTRQS